MASPATREARVGLAYAAYVPALLRARPGCVDFVELPYERLRADPTCADVAKHVPLVLHCASLSIAGVVPAANGLLRDIREAARRLHSPWIGEHLAFVTAPDLSSDEVFDVGYTVAPPFNETTLQRVVSAYERYQRSLGVPLLLENPPQYFATPTSTMTQLAFIRELANRTDVGLLLDITHLIITARNMGFDPRRALRTLPLERVREIHLSGIRAEEGVAWDDHGALVPREAFDLLRIALRHGAPEAVTLEYNWPATFGVDVVTRELERIRRITRQGARECRIAS